MKKNKFIQAVLLISITMVWAGCSQDIEWTGQESAAQLLIDVSDTGVSNIDPAQSRAADKDYKTTFVQGDKMGLFAVKDGALVEDIKNMPLTFNGSGWTPQTPLLYDEETGGEIKYYAYYPYKAGLENKVNLNADDFFFTIVSEWEPAIDQSKSASHTASDLMTSNMVQAQKLNGRFSLQFKLEHRMGLIVIKLPSTQYVFTDASDKVLSEIPYTIIPSNIKFYENAVKEENLISLFHDETEEVYRYIMNPSLNFIIKGQYNKQKEYTIETEGKLETGKYKKFLVDGGVETIRHHLQIGDLFYSDGRLLSVSETNPPKEGCIGIVYYVGNTFPSMLYADYNDTGKDILRKEYPTCNHGLVIALNDAVSEPIFWENTTKTDIGAWFTASSFTNSYFSPTMSNYTSADVYGKMLGYNNTKLVEMMVRAGVTGTENINIGSLKEYRDAVLTPETATTWFIPSIQELFTLYDKKAIVSRQLTMVGGKGLDFTFDTVSKICGYWSSTEYKNDMMYAFHNNVGTTNIKDARTYKAARYARFRYSFAF